VSVSYTLAQVSPRHGYTKLQGHIETRQIRIPFSFTAGEVVDRVFRLENGSCNPSHSGFGNRSAFQGTSRGETAADYGQHRAIEERLVLGVVGTIQKN
jgi:hypothetical protein